eukprot:3942003-Rhodomonas_salina.3
MSVQYFMRGGSSCKFNDVVQEVGLHSAAIKDKKPRSQYTLHRAGRRHNDDNNEHYAGDEYYWVSSPFFIRDCYAKSGTDLG